MAMCTDEMCVDMHIAVQRNKKDDKAGMGKYFLIAYLFASFVFSSSFTCYFLFHGEITWKEKLQP